MLSCEETVFVRAIDLDAIAQYVAGDREPTFAGRPAKFDTSDLRGARDTWPTPVIGNSEMSSEPDTTAWAAVGAFALRALPPARLAS